MTHRRLVSISHQFSLQYATAEWKVSLIFILLSENLRQNSCASSKCVENSFIIYGTRFKCFGRSVSGKAAHRVYFHISRIILCVRRRRTRQCRPTLTSENKFLGAKINSWCYKFESGVRWIRHCEATWMEQNALIWNERIENAMAWRQMWRSVDAREDVSVWACERVNGANAAINRIAHSAPNKIFVRLRM